MPCDQVRTVQVDLKKADIGILRTAFERATGLKARIVSGNINLTDSFGNYAASWSRSTGAIQMWGGTYIDADDVTREYSRATIEATVKKIKGWQWKWASDSKVVGTKGSLGGKKDELAIDVLKDGRVKITTGAISQANHTSADRAVRDIQHAIGGAVEVNRNPKAKHSHVHNHNHLHVHE